VRLYPVMKRPSIILLGLLITTAIMAWVMTRSDSEPKTESRQLLTKVPVIPAPLIWGTPAPADRVEVVEEPLQPVQTLEERSDAMLFEIDALQGMPFDQAIVDPFE
jgi:hypothetical protein